jgi:hypothetical protein
MGIFLSWWIMFLFIQIPRYAWIYPSDNEMHGLVYIKPKNLPEPLTDIQASVYDGKYEQSFISPV